jgi:uncharacterized protein YjfI (DUF2170 family)
MRKRLQLFNAYFFVLLACTWTQRTLAQSNRKILFNGNEIELSTPSTDTLYIENIETGEREIKVSIPDPFPIAMNGKTIINETHCSPLPERSLNEYFIDLVLQNKTLFDQLTDGQYYINPRHFVINEEGSIKYYKFEGITLRMHHSSIDIVTKNDVVKSKPHPETFLKCATLLALDQKDCLVFEDTPKGVECAMHAGIKAVVILGEHQKEEFDQFTNVIHFANDYTQLPFD